MRLDGRRDAAPGGTLVMDYHLPNFDRDDWDAWIERPTLPSTWPTRGDRRVAALEDRAPQPWKDERVILRFT